jgi:hypothetical protein
MNIPHISFGWLLQQLFVFFLLYIYTYLLFSSTSSKFYDIVLGIHLIRYSQSNYHWCIIFHVDISFFFFFIMIFKNAWKYNNHACTRFFSLSLSSSWFFIIIHFDIINKLIFITAMNNLEIFMIMVTEELKVSLELSKRIWHGAYINLFFMSNFLKYLYWWWTDGCRNIIFQFNWINSAQFEVIFLSCCWYYHIFRWSYYFVQHASNVIFF